MAQCKICNREFKVITNTHLQSAHKTTLEQYCRKFGNEDCGFIRSNLLPKTDPRFIKWRESLKKRPPPWIKGHTKATHSGVAKISDTFKKKKINNFSEWQKKMVNDGKFITNAVPLKRNEKLAELTGVILGDGHIHKLARTQSLTISSNAKNIGFIVRYASIIQEVFGRKAFINKPRMGCVKIQFYQKFISERLEIPDGARGKLYFEIPKWILQNREFLICYLRGLYEAEGSFCVHKPTSTYKFFFSNRNESLLNNVYEGMKILGFHPHRSKYQIQISRKEEVYEAMELLKFRQY